MKQQVSEVAGVVMSAIEDGAIDGVVFRNQLLRWMPEEQLVEFLRVSKIDKLVKKYEESC